MGNHASLIKSSQIPGLSAIFSTTSLPRKTVLVLVFSLLMYLTLRDLQSIVSDYFRYPITVSVLVSESRVLPFPAVTVCNLNPVHRGRFCSSDLPKPENIQMILCSSLTDLFEVCRITESLEDLVQEGRDICTGKKGNDKKKKSNRRGIKRPKSPKTPLGKSGPKGIQRRMRKPFARRRPNNNNGNGSDVTDTDGINGNTSEAFKNKKLYFLSLVGIPELAPIRLTAGNRMRRKRSTFAARVEDPFPVSGGREGVGMTSDSFNYPTHEYDLISDMDRGSAVKSAPFIGRLCGGSSGAKKRTKRESQLNLRSLLATFKSLQSGDLSGGLLQPFTVSYTSFPRIRSCI